MINLLIGLGLAITANMLLGSITSIINKKFNWKKLSKGTIKGCVVLVSIGLLWIAGVLNPNVVVMDDFTITMGVELIALSSFVWYAGQAILKLKNIMYPSKKEEESKTVNLNITA